MPPDAVVIPTVAEQRYVVSMVGEVSDWVHYVDAYRSARADTWHASIQGAGFLRPRVHTIARVHGDYECQILHSNDPLWQAAA
jgi:hypothetical protein